MSFPSITGGMSGPATAGGSSASQNNSGWTVSRGGMTSGACSALPWLIVAALVAVVILKGKK